MGFAHLQGASGTFASGSTCTVTLPVNPTQGNCVTVGLAWGGGGGTPTLPTCSDSNSNAYTVGAAIAGSTTNGFICLFYLLSAPANATKTLTLGWSGTTTASGDGLSDEFTVSGGTTSFDKAGTAAGGSGTSFTTPSITPATAGSLLYGVASCQGNWTTPAAGSTLGVWTGAAGTPGPNGHGAEYLVNSTNTATAFNATQSPTGTHEENIISIKFTASATTIPQLACLGVGVQ